MKTQAEVRLFQRLMSASALVAMSRGDENEAVLLARIDIAMRWVLDETSEPPGLSEDSVAGMENAIADRRVELLRAIIEASERGQPTPPRKL